MQAAAPGVYATLVLVTDQFQCERIIRSARVIADLTKTELLVFSVMKDSATSNPAALEHLFGVAKEYEARMIVAFSDNPLSSISHFIRENKVINAITGMPQNKNSILVKLWERLANIQFYTVSEDGELKEVLFGAYQEETFPAVQVSSKDALSPSV